MASKNISFETIPSSIRVPGVYTEYNTKLAVRNLPVNPQKVVLIAAMLATANTQALKPVQVFSDDEAAKLFGNGSQAHLMTRQAIRNNNYINLSVMGVADNAAGVKATATIKITGTAQKKGVVSLSIDNDYIHVSVANDDTAVQVANKILSHLNTIDDLSIVATAATNTVTLTAKNAGQHGNSLGLSVTKLTDGVSATVTPFSNGDINASLESALDAISGEHYHIITSNFDDIENVKRLRDHVENVSNSIEQRGCIAVIGQNKTLSTGTTLTSQINSGRITCSWLKGTQTSNSLLAASYAAVIAFEEDPARPLNTLQLKGVHIPAVDETPTFSEFNTALYNGLTPFEIMNGRVQILRAISTYTKSATGTDDPSLLDITTIRTLDYVRTAINQRLSLRFPREKLSQRTAPKVRSEIFDVLLKLEELEIIEQVEQNKDKLIVERDLQDANRLNAAIPADVVNGLHVMANRIDLYL